MDSPDEVTLYDKDSAVITPSWLTLDDTSFAIRTIVRIETGCNKPPRVSAGVAALVFLLLSVISALHVIRHTLPPLLAWSFLLVSAGLMLYAAWFTFMANTRYRLAAVLDNDQCVELAPGDHASQQAMHAALLKAMNWNLGHQWYSAERRQSGGDGMGVAEAERAVRVGARGGDEPSRVQTNRRAARAMRRARSVAALDEQQHAKHHQSTGRIKRLRR